MNKYAKNKRGFALMIALLAIMALAFVIFAYNMLVRSKAFETRHLTYNMKASKYAHAVAQFAARKLQNAINQLNPNEMDDDVKNEIREKLISGNVTPGMQLAEGCANLNKACTEYLKELVKESDVDDNTIVIARVFSGDNDSLTPSEYFGAEVNFVVNEVKKLKDYAKEHSTDENSEHFSDKEIYGTIGVEVTVTVGHSQLKIKANESDNLISFPFKVVSSYPINEKETQCTLYVCSIAGGGGKKSDLNADKTAWGCPPSITLDNAGGTGKIFLGARDYIEAFTSDFSDPSFRYGYTSKKANGCPLTQDLSGSDITIGYLGEGGINFGIRYSNWSIGGVKQAMKSPGQWKPLLGDMFDEIERYYDESGPLWIALFGNNNGSKTKIYTINNKDIYDKTVYLCYLIDKGQNNKLIAAFNNINSDDLSKIKSGNDGDLIPQDESVISNPAFLQNGKELFHMTDSMLPSIHTEFRDYYSEFVDRAKAQFNQVSYIQQAGNSNGEDNNDITENDFCNLSANMKLRLIYDFTKDNDSEINVNDFFHGESSAPVVKLKSYPNSYNGTVFSNSSINGINGDKYYAIDDESSEKAISGDNNAFIYISGTPKLAPKSRITGGLACSKVEYSKCKISQLSEQSEIIYNGNINNTTSNAEDFCVAIGPVGARP